MKAKRAAQSFRGLVREHLAQIERDIERGISQATILEQLGVPGASVLGLRDALYRARRRARMRAATSSSAPTSLEMASAVHLQSTQLDLKGIPPAPEAKAKRRVQPLRDFLTVSKMYRDQEVIGRKPR